MEETIFTKIIKGEVLAYKIYEDEKTLAFLDIEPTRYGHVLVVPKVQIDQYIDLPDDDYMALWRAVKKVAARLREIIGKERVVVKIIGTDVPHVHVHLFPLNKGEKPYHDESSPTLTSAEFQQLAEKLRFS